MDEGWALALASRRPGRRFAVPPAKEQPLPRVTVEIGPRRAPDQPPRAALPAHVSALRLALVRCIGARPARLDGVDEYLAATIVVEAADGTDPDGVLDEYAAVYGDALGEVTLDAPCDVRGRIIGG